MVYDITCTSFLDSYLTFSLGPIVLFTAVMPMDAHCPHMATKRKGKIVDVGMLSALGPGAWAGACPASKPALNALILRLP